MNMKDNCNINSIVNEFYNQIKNFIRSKVKNDEIAEDLTQEVMYNLVKSCQKTENIINLKSWLYKVARNIIYQYYQKNIEYNKLDDNYEGEDVEENLFMAEEYIKPMLKTINKSDQEILSLADIENIPQKEIAEQLNISLSAAKMKIQRARKKLLHSFKDCCAIEYDANGNFTHCEIKKQC